LLKGADPNIQNKGKIRPLSIAVRMGFVAIAEVLLRFGAKFTDNEEMNLLQRLKKSTAAIPINGEANPVINHTQGLFGSFSSVKAIKGAKVEVLEPEMRDIVQASLETGILSLPNAAYLGMKEPLENVVNINNLNDQDEKKATMLMKAAYSGYVPLISYLLELRCDADAIDLHGNTAMVWAALKGHLDVVKLLHDNGADINGAVVNSKKKNVIYEGQMTPLIAASYKGHYDIAEYLIREKCDLNLRCGPGRGKSAVMAAAWCRHLDLLKLLVDNKAYVDPNVDEWLSKGIIQMKKNAQDANAWTNFGIEANRREGLGGRRASLQDKLLYLSAEENAVVVQIGTLLVSRAGVVATADTNKADAIKAPQVLEKGEEVGNVQKSVSRPILRRSTRPQSTRNYREGLNLEVK
jgi:ankyrin repeat protein